MFLFVVRATICILCFGPNRSNACLPNLCFIATHEAFHGVHPIPCHAGVQTRIAQKKKYAAPTHEAHDSLRHRIRFKSFFFSGRLNSREQTIHTYSREWEYVFRSHDSRTCRFFFSEPKMAHEQHDGGFFFYFLLNEELSYRQPRWVVADYGLLAFNLTLSTALPPLLFFSSRLVEAEC